MHKSFWTLDKDGNQVLRDLYEENKEFTRDGYFRGEFDGNNYQWYEMFDTTVFGANGCDYERKGCQIQPGDVVLDIGGNIGLFAYRAEHRGAGRVISFEPLSPTYSCLVRNAGPKTEVYKLAVGGENRFVEFKIPVNFLNIGGASSNKNDNRDYIHKELAYMINVNSIFDTFGKIDFMKIDIEGGEVELFDVITDSNLSSLRCLAAEFHNSFPEYMDFQTKVWDRMMSLGFMGFAVYRGGKSLITLNFWK